MKRLLAISVITLVIAGSLTVSYAGDDEWATAGKVLAIAEGVRVITGGNVDVVGNVTGINRHGGIFSGGNSSYGRYNKYSNRYAKRKVCKPTKTWVPHYVWKRKYIPEHEEYDENYGKIIVEAHYIQYRVEDGGYWRS